jgi:hypothetical protein
MKNGNREMNYTAITVCLITMKLTETAKIRLTFPLVKFFQRNQNTMKYC